IYLIAYGVWRFFIEFARGDYRGSFIPGLSPSQFWSIILVILGVAYLLFRLFYWNKKIGQKNEPTAV
ncbi:MAG: prolipoprotein diacylglyceryl transferase, partial [Campylobacter sp.]|nr:prolipoprotein diacylglyceryl transferase [Campylobacter sp.]